MKLRKKIALWVAEKKVVPYRFRKSLVKRACPAILYNHDFEIDFYGLRYAGNTKNAIDRMFFMFGGCKKYMLAMLKKYSLALKNEGMVFLDVGASVGNQALFMSRYVKKVHAFEPNQKARKALEANISLNKIKNVFVHSVGLGNTNDIMPFYVPSNDNFVCGSFYNSKASGHKYYGDVEVRVGDDFIREKNIKNIDIIKIDVSGFERKVLDGLTKTLENFRPMIVMEVSKTTRINFGSVNDFESVFPDGYMFYKFSGVNREKENYNLTKFDYDLHDSHLDVIAIPKEKLVHLDGGIIKK